MALTFTPRKLAIGGILTILTVLAIDLAFENHSERKARKQAEIAELVKVQKDHESSIAHLLTQRTLYEKRNADLDTSYRNTDARLAQLKAQAEAAQLQQQTATNNLQTLAAQIAAEQSRLTGLEAQSAEFESLLSSISKHEERAMTVAPHVENGAIFSSQIFGSWNDYRITNVAAGYTTYTFRRGPVTFLHQDLDPQGLAAMSSCMETGKCLTATLQTLLKHEQKHTLGDNIGVEKPTSLYQLTDWDARVVFIYYTLDVGMPVVAFKFSEMANAQELHAEADLLRDQLLSQ
jgi:hypothetical protein